MSVAEKLSTSVEPLCWTEIREPRAVDQAGARADRGHPTGNGRRAHRRTATTVPSHRDDSAVASIRPTVTRTAAADEHGYLVQLVELSTLGVTEPAVHVNVADLGYGVDGVLGMKFLLDYNIEIRSAERRILIERI
jgi:hypothetical protein